MHRAHARYAAEAESDSATLQRYGSIVAKVARKLAARTAGMVTPDDLWSAGAMGLLEAARRFDAAREIRFETFAEHRVRGAMLDEMRRMDHLPRRFRARIESVERARDTLARALQREPEDHEIAAAAGLDLDELGALQALAARPDAVVDSLESPHAPADEEVDLKLARKRLAAAVETLPERLQIVLSLHYVEGLTYREIARILDVSEPRVCQLHGDAVKRLREIMGSSATPAAARIPGDAPRR